MLFKAQSASVRGIDAYLVEVGSARMQDFNVVGLPDNAVKESRDRIESPLRNCGFEFPHGQGVTINLAPADIRKEGSAFDLPMALGLVRPCDLGASSFRQDQEGWMNAERGDRVEL
jgi:magnesium chelatase family protein